MTKHISNWLDLEKYGLCFLTGESCAYGIRLLFDLNELGKDLICNFFGLRIIPNTSNIFNENWNTKVNGFPAIASILLPPGIFRDLAEFCLFHIDHCYGIFIQSEHYLIGCDKSDFEKYQRIFGDDKRYICIRNINYCPDLKKIKDDRNIHQMSQRNK